MVARFGVRWSLSPMVTSVKVTPFMFAYMPQFDTSVSTDTGDFWSYWAGYSNSYQTVEVDPGDTVAMHLSISPTANPGTIVHGVINVDNLYLFSPFIDTGGGDGGDQLASIPYSYTVGNRVCNAPRKSAAAVC